MKFTTVHPKLPILADNFYKESIHDDLSASYISSHYMLFDFFTKS